MSRIETNNHNPDVSLLTFGFALICITPFMSIWRVGPLSSYYLESGSLLFALILVLATALTGKMSVRLPANSVYFLVLADFWWLHARVMALPELLALAGIDPKSITAVVFSHFHGDHINGLRNKAGALAFPNAKLYVPEPEWAWWMDDSRMAAAPEAMKAGFAKAHDAMNHQCQPPPGSGRPAS